MRVRVARQELSICRLAADAPIPSWAWGELLSITRTGTELSVVCETRALPDSHSIDDSSKGDLQHESGWGALHLVGPLPFEAVGILAQLSSLLAEAKVSIFVISTFDTDIVLIKKTELEVACATLQRAGYEIFESSQTDA